MEADRAWCAGFFDGEGYTGARKTPSGTYQVSLQIQQKGREPLDKVQQILGGEIYALKSRPGIFKWSIGKRSLVEEALNKMWPYLTEVKKKQALVAISKERE